MIDKYIEVNVHTIEQYELELKKKKILLVLSIMVQLKNLKNI